MKTAYVNPRLLSSDPEDPSNNVSHTHVPLNSILTCGIAKKKQRMSDIRFFTFALRLEFGGKCNKIDIRNA